MGKLMQEYLVRSPILLLHLALSTFVANDIEIYDHTGEYINAYIEQVIKENILYEHIEGFSVILQPYTKQFNSILKKYKIEDSQQCYGSNIFIYL